MIALATMGKFMGPQPISWDSGGDGATWPPQIKYVDRKLPVIRITKINKKDININIHVNNIKVD